MAGTAGFAFLRKSHGGSNNPPDCLQEPPFESGAKKKQWQGRLDSNQRMSASKADALPLGDAPVFVCSKQRYPKDNALRSQRVTGLYGVGKGTRTLDPRNHNPML